MSDLDGKKPKKFLNFAKKNKLGFLALEYSGHGKSSGKFIDGNISKWTKETSLLIKKVVKTNKIILVGTVGSTPESKGSSNGTSMLCFSLTVDRPQSASAPVQKQDHFDVVAWGNSADNAPR